MTPREAKMTEKGFTLPSSLFTGGFWDAIKTEATAITWNLRDARRQTSTTSLILPSLDHAIVSAERLLVMVNERVVAQIQRASEQRLLKNTLFPKQTAPGSRSSSMSNQGS